MERFGLGGVGDDRQDRPENFFSGDRHIRRDVSKDRRFNEISLVPAIRPSGAAANKARTFVDANLDVTLDAVILRAD